MTRNQRKKFHIVLIKPSKYDDEGYVIRWVWGVTGSNSLACLYALAEQAASERILGDDVEIVIHVYDEVYQKVPVRKIRGLQRQGDKVLVCMVGVQTNQYARALDLAMICRSQGLTCMIGGFHVSGSLAMLPEIPAEIRKAIDEGITIVAGEVERQWNSLIRAAYEGRLERVYNFLAEKPDLRGVPGPCMPEISVMNFFGRMATFDAGRGCPFKCSFCTIINVQGNEMRGRTADDIEKIVRRQHGAGVKDFFICDDNFARHKEWEAIADRLIDLKENHGIRLSIMIQCDTAVHRIPRFIEKMARAGVRRVFIGMESVNPENLKAVGKHHNQLKEYRKMLQLWHKAGVLTMAGYIVGFPGDTYGSIMKDVEVLKNELPLEFPEFFIMTPLPGSADHRELYLAKKLPVTDTNLYDSTHVCFDPPRMSREELMRAYQDAWRSFYSKEHIRTLLLRRKGPRQRILRNVLIWFCASIWLENTHPFLGGFFRRKGRKERRPGLPVEPALPYYARRIAETVRYAFGLLKLVLEIYGMVREANQPQNAGYTDAALACES